MGVHTMETQLLDTIDNVKGEIYCITNKLNQKVYIGQTLTHRKNRGRYRPFGSIGRFKDHMSEAIRNTKQNQCWYLNSAIRKYGVDQFEVHCLERCERIDLDSRERFYIQHYASLYPAGYNLTAGGRTLQSIPIEPDTPLVEPNRVGGCAFRSHETRSRISKRLQSALESPDSRHALSERARQQHLSTKLNRFKSIHIDENQIDTYIRQQKQRVVIHLGSEKITFASKHATPEERYTHARNFLRSLTTSATLPN